MPLEGVRMLDNDELALLRDHVDSQFTFQQIVSISASVLFVALYIATVIFPNPVIFWLMAGAAALMGMFVIWLLSNRGSWLRRYKSLQADLVSGVVHRFRREGIAESFEVLPVSEVVFRSNGHSPKKWRRAPIIAVAKTPPIASIAADWLQPIDRPVGRFFSGKRNLSGAEREEIRRWAVEVLDHRRRHAVSYVCWAAFLGWLSRWGYPDLFYAALAVASYTGSKICSEIRLFLALQRDAKVGTVIINRRAKAKDGGIEPIGAPSEFLPSAQLKWTEDGSPAEWRKEV
jgi:hypothetical protein